MQPKPLDSSLISYHVVEHTKGLISLIESLQNENQELRETIRSLEVKLNSYEKVNLSIATIPCDLIEPLQLAENALGVEITEQHENKPISQATVPPEEMLVGEETVAPEEEEFERAHPCVSDSMQLAMDFVLNEDAHDDIIELTDSPMMADLPSSREKEVTESKRSRPEPLPFKLRTVIAKPIFGKDERLVVKNYRESVKQKPSRENMPAFECQQCRAFYNLTGMRQGLCQKHGKHRMKV